MPRRPRQPSPEYPEYVPRVTPHAARTVDVREHAALVHLRPDVLHLRAYPECVPQAGRACIRLGRAGLLRPPVGTDCAGRATTAACMYVWAAMPCRGHAEVDRFVNPERLATAEAFVRRADLRAVGRLLPKLRKLLRSEALSAGCESRRRALADATPAGRSWHSTEAGKTAPHSPARAYPWCSARAAKPEAARRSGRRTRTAPPCKVRRARGWPCAGPLKLYRAEWEGSARPAPGRPSHPSSRCACSCAVGPSVGRSQRAASRVEWDFGGFRRTHAPRARS